MFFVHLKAIKLTTILTTTKNMFYLKEPNSKNKTLIIVQYYVARDKAKFRISTNIKINPDNWDKKNRIPIRKRGGLGIESQKISVKLNEINKKIEDLRYKFGKELTVGDLKLAFNKSEEFVYALDYFEAFLNERIKVSDVAYKTIQKYKVVLNKLVVFQIHKKRQYKLSDLKEQFFIDLIIYLRDKHDLYDNTLNRYISVIKTFLRWCIKKGYSPPMDFAEVRIKKHETDDVALTREEVELIASAELSGAKDRARDLFLIGVYSGQRWSDYSVFDKADVRNGLLYKRAKKTSSISKIPLHTKLKAILDKYDWNLPKISSQKFNVHIQQICKALEINDKIKFTHSKGNHKKEEIKEKWEKIGSHTARRTYITLASEGNVPDHFIMEITGIKDSNTLKKYKKVNNKAIIEHTKDLF
tara:strand:+ start:70 stop:1311 length:1242 start_codon:yes stop_codon:yes gene_type:complete